MIFGELYLNEFRLTNNFGASSTVSSGPPESDSSPLTCVVAQDFLFLSFSFTFDLIFAHQRREMVRKFKNKSIAMALGSLFSKAGCLSSPIELLSSRISSVVKYTSVTLYDAEFVIPPFSLSKC